MVTWEELLRARDGKPGAWFRGQANPWPLRARLHRIVQQQMGIPPDWDWAATPRGYTDFADYRQRVRKLQVNLYEAFRNLAWPLLPHPIGRWELLFLMQHYGLPTRLLDFTRSFPFALYMALKDADVEKDDGPTIFLVDPAGVNKSHGQEGLFPLREESFEWHHPEGEYPPADGIVGTVAIAPPHSNPRIVAQQATFLLSGDFPGPLEKETQAGVVTKLELDADAICHAYDFLGLAGALRESIYFPELEALARDVMRDYDLAQFL